MEKKRNPVLDQGKLPPMAIELEQIVLGSLMLEKSIVPEIINLLTADVFYKEAHQVIFDAIVDMYNHNQPIDIVTVTNWLIKKKTIDITGGPLYITQLTSRIASTANVESHAAILIQKYIAREIIRVSTEAIRDAYDDNEDAFDQLANVDKSISTISEFSARGGTMVHISSITPKSIESAERREIMSREGKISGIPTGLHELDKATGGLQNSELIVVAARPGMGKTSVMLHLAKYAAKSGQPVCIYSLEMQDERLSDNLLLSMCNVDKDKFKNGFLSSKDWVELKEAQKELDRLPVYIDPKPSVTMRYIRSNASVLKKKGKCGMVLIDYLGLIDLSSDEKNRNREQEVAKASRTAKLIAKELNIPVVLLSQLSRSVENRSSSDKIPQLSDLRESGAIEQDADMVIFIYRPEYYGITEDEDGSDLRGVGKLIIAKNRNGPLTNVKFRHNPSMTHIYDYERYPDDRTGGFSPNTSFVDLPY